MLLGSIGCFLLSHADNPTMGLAPRLKIYNSRETLSKIMDLISHEQKGAYLRCGDGDLNLAHGKRSGSHSVVTPRLQFEMQEVFDLNGPTILKSLPLTCKELGSLEEGMFPGCHLRTYKDCLRFLKQAVPFWGTDIKDVYSAVALHHVATVDHNYCLEFLRFLKAHNSCVLVGNKEIPEHIKTLLFGAGCEFIPTPTKNAYAEIDAIEKQCLEAINKKKGYKVIILSTGNTGRILQKRLWPKLDNVFLFDFGSLMDALCGWETRKWIRLNTSSLNSLKEILINSL